SSSATTVPPASSHQIVDSAIPPPPYAYCFMSPHSGSKDRDLRDRVDIFLTLRGYFAFYRRAEARLLGGPA
ncbi:MAG: hypothetical protein KGQ30_06150, partial [Burkholderiales bacterium]|nr:hypothetical protein [Burkholderiales bacterium]